MLQQRQDWEVPQIKDLNLVMSKDYFFMADNEIFYALGMQDNYLLTVLIRHFLTHHFLQQFYCYTAGKIIRPKMS